MRVGVVQLAHDGLAVRHVTKVGVVRPNGRICKGARERQGLAILSDADGADVRIDILVLLTLELLGEGFGAHNFEPCLGGKCQQGAGNCEH